MSVSEYKFPGQKGQGPGWGDYKTLKWSLGKQPHQAYRVKKAESHGLKPGAASKPRKRNRPRILKGWMAEGVCFD